jgi:hypothetical protein
LANETPLFPRGMTINKSDENRYDSNDDQKFDQSEPFSPLEAIHVFHTGSR